MGASVSGINSDNEFIEESKKENFLLSILQCKLEGPLPFNSAILNKRKNTANFVIMVKGELSLPKLWHSSRILVCCISLPEPNLEEFQCSFYQYHDQPFLAICVNAPTYYHICFFMNKCRFFIQREEFLERILKCQDEGDVILDSYVTRPGAPPKVRTPAFRLAAPADDTMAIGDSEIFSFDSSSVRYLSAPSHVGNLSQREGSSSFRDPVSESDFSTDNTQSGTSSVFGLVSEPSTRSIKRANDASSTFYPVSEPSSMDSFAGLTHDTASGSSVICPIPESASSASGRRRRKVRKDYNSIGTNDNELSDSAVRRQEVDQRGARRPVENNVGTLQDTLSSEGRGSRRSLKRRSAAPSDVSSVRSRSSSRR